MFTKNNGWVGAMALAIGALMTVSAAATPISDLPGRWKGWGAVKHANGSSEQLRCIATYFVKGESVRQNLRCASASYKIDTTAELMVSDGKVSGDWQERTYSVGGSVMGNVRSTGFDLAINGPDFTAKMLVGTSTCKQSIDIRPEGFEIASISVKLGKC